MGPGVVEVVYCEGWDAGGRVPVGPLTRQEAAVRDAAGAQYSVALRTPGHVVPAVVLDVARARHYLGVWRLDARGRRTHHADLRQITGDRLFLVRRREWRYATAEVPEFAPDAWRTTHNLRPGGRGTVVVEERGERGGSFHTTSGIPEADRWVPVPAFGDWAGVTAALDPPPFGPGTVLVVTADAALAPAPAPPWAPPAPARPRYLAELFTPGLRFRTRAGDEVTVAEPELLGLLRLPTGHLVAADPPFLDDERMTVTTTIPAGTYRVEAGRITLHWRYYDEEGTATETTVTRVVVTGKPVLTWEMAHRDDQDPRLLGEGEFYGYGVDTATGGLADACAATVLRKAYEGYFKNPGNRSGAAAAQREPDFPVLTDPATGANLITFPLPGDGSYPLWIGRDADGALACLVADTFELHDAEPLT